MRSNPRVVAAAGLIAAAFLLAACGDDDADRGAGGETSGGELSVEVDPESVAPGGTVAATVVNDSDREFSYGAGYELERKKDDAFVPVDLGERAVIQIAYVAEPAGTGPAVAVKVPGNAKPGTWRVIIARDVPGGGDLSAEFEVTGG
jgi:hypothetical protein